MSQRLFDSDVVFYQRFLKCGGYYRGNINGTWGTETDAASKAFLSDAAALAGRIGTFDARSEANIATLHIPAQAAARQFLSRLAAAHLDARIISGTRSYAEQNALFRKGRFGNPPPVVTNARGGLSNHNFGIAWDIGLFENGRYLTSSAPYRNAAQIGMAPEIEWGGNWKTFKDTPHYQLKTGLSVSQLRERFENGRPFFN